LTIKINAMQDIYNLELHESADFENGLSVLRVPGGWIYTQNEISVFVPYSNEYA
jgi:hypothetical protein